MREGRVCMGEGGGEGVYGGARRGAEEIDMRDRKRE